MYYYYNNNNSINGTLWKKSNFIITKHSYCLVFIIINNACASLPKKLTSHYNHIISNFKTYTLDRATTL